MVILQIPVISKLIERRSTTSRLMKNTDDPDHTFFKLMFDLAKSGVNVTSATAMQSSVVWRAVTLLSGTIASLPLPVYKRLKPRGKERDADHELYYKLHTRPNPELASNAWRLMGLSNQLLWGNWYNEIVYKNNKPYELWPIPPWRVKPQRGKEGNLYYEVQLPGGDNRQIPGWAMLHVKNLYIDGDEGVSCLKAARESIGLGLAANEFASRFFGNGANLGGIVEYPGKLSEAARDNFKQSVQEGYQGLGNSYRLMLLEEGLKFHRTAVPPNEGQMIESRKFQVADIGRFFFITQLHKLGDLEKSSFNNIEHQSIEFVTDTIQPLLVNIEQEINHKLFYAAGDQEHFAEFLIAGLLRGDTAARHTAYATARQWGWMSANDVRELENLNPLPGKQGDIYLIPMNMIPAEQIEDYEPTAKGEPKPVEENAAGEKEYRSGIARTRIAQNYQRIIVDAAARVIRREEADIMKKARDLLGERNKYQALLTWIEEFYKKHPEYITRQMLPVITALAEAIQAEVADEINAAAEMSPELEKFAAEYTDRFARDHSIRSFKQLEQVLVVAHEEGKDEVEALQQRFSEWNNNRADKIAMYQTTAVNGAVTRFIMTLAGVTALVVRNTGSKTCPFCEQLDGRVVGIEQPILPAGSELVASDGSGMKIYGAKMNPPFHLGCVCVLEAERQ